MRIGRDAIQTGERIPPFYYGLTYLDLLRQESVFHIMPFNYLIRFYRFVCYKWLMFRSTPPERFRKAWLLMRKIQQKAYAKGLEVGKRIEIDRRDEQDKAFRDGYEYAFESLLKNLDDGTLSKEINKGE